MSASRLLATSALLCLVAALIVVGLGAGACDAPTPSAETSTTTTVAATTTVTAATTTAAPATTVAETAGETEDPAPGDGLYPAPTPGKYGYIDATGAWVIEPRFADAWYFHEGLAAVQPVAGGLWGYIDPTGSSVIEPRFTYPASFHDGLAVVRAGGEDGLFGMIDKAGAWVIEPRFASLSGLSEGFAAAGVATGNGVDADAPLLYGYIDRTGAWVIEPRVMMQAGRFSDGLAPIWVEERGPWGYIDKTGEMVLQPESLPLCEFSEGLAVVRDASGKYGYADTAGEVVIRPQFDLALAFSDGLALIGMGQKDLWGERGEYVFMSRVFPMPGQFERYAYIDKTGEVVIEGPFDEAYSFRDGLAAVVIDDRIGYVDTTGAWAIRPLFHGFMGHVGHFYRGLALQVLDYVDENGDTWFYRVYIDKTGKVIWRSP